MTGVLVCAALGVALRLAVSWACADSGLFADMEQYHARAVHVAAEGTLYPDVLRGPGYPALLAAAYRMSGVDLWTARVVNALVGGLLVVLTGILASAAGAGRRAWIAAAVVAVYPALVLSSIYVMPEGLYALLLVTGLVLVRHRTLPFAAAAGAAAGLAILTRSVAVCLVAAPLAVWGLALVRGEAPRRAAVARVAAFAVALAVVIAPWLVHARHVAGGSLLDSTSGVNLLAGNNPRATGRLELDDVQWLHDTYVAGATSIADGNRRAIAAGVSWAATHPAAWARLALAKLGYLFGLEGREHAWAYGHAYFGARSRTTVLVWGALLLISFPLLCVAAALGVTCASVELRGVHAAMLGVGLATAALHVASFGESRFHLPLVPLLAVAASLGASAASGPGRRGAERDEHAGGRGTRTRRVTSPAAIAAWLLVALAALGWMRQAPELSAQLERLAQPDGWRSRPPY